MIQNMAQDLFCQGSALGTAEVRAVLKLSQQYLQMWKGECYVTYTKATRLPPNKKYSILPSQAGYLEVFVSSSMRD